jgi:hypothetical protein
LAAKLFLVVRVRNDAFHLPSCHVYRRACSKYKQANLRTKDEADESTL